MECMQEQSQRASGPGTVTLRGIDPDLRAALDTEAGRLGLSLNAVILQILRSSLGLGPDRLFHDLDHLIGVWSKEEAEEFMASIQFFEEIDESFSDDAPGDAPNHTPSDT